MKKQLLPVMATLLLGGCGDQSTTIKTDPYPVARMDESVVDDYFGTKVADPYRWMEDDRSQETADWVKAENVVTQNYLAQIPFREQIKERLTTLFNYPKVGTPFKVGEYYFTFKNDGLQNQSVLYYKKGKEGTDEIFLDPNTLSSDGTVALGSVTFSNDDRYCAYSVSKAGSDWVEIKVMDVATRELMPDLIEWVKFSGAIWSDADGFYYSRYDEPSGSALSEKNEYQKVYFHKLGTTQDQDVLIYEDTQHPLRYFAAITAKDSKWLLINGSEGTYGTELLYKNIADKGDFKVLFPGFEHEYSVVDIKGDDLYLMSNEGAMNWQVIKVDLKNPSKVDVVVAETSDLLKGVSKAGGYLMLTYLKDASSRVYQYEYDGRLVREVELPGIGTASGFDGEKEDTQVFYSFSSYNVPPTSYTLDLTNGESTLYSETKVPFDPSQYVVDQEFFTSKDGTKVPMFIIYKKGMVKDGSNPTYLYAYGGFSIPMTPNFSATRIALLEQGGIYVVANIRGGSEYGEAWHQGGMKENKQNVFDDFIGAAEYLIAQKYTSKEKLAIAGGSNGGLLVGACMVQRPDLYSVCFPAVGVLDMLRYHKFTIGWGWAVEYGSSDYADEFEYIYKYSPLHNIHKGTCYPATMITTADHDDRVVPAHSFKFAATLQAAQSCDNPTLIRIDSNAGHGAGKPMSKIIDEQTDIWSFMLWNTDSGYTPVK